MNLFSDPLKLVPLAICAVAGIGLYTGKMTLNDVMGLLIAAGILHPAISAIHNQNPDPPK